VLIVDDNLDVADLLAEALRDEGYTTEAAHDGRRALEAWSRFAPHAGVLDVGLPDLDGYTLAREVRAQHGRVPVLIAATGYGQPTDRQRAMESGFDMHLVKPVSVRELLGVLDDRVLSGAAPAH
jgi:CheY-like chemotaxis protein